MPHAIVLTCVYRSASLPSAGATRESVNKCLHEWQRAGFIRMDKRVITMVDRATLEAMAEPD